MKVLKVIGGGVIVLLVAIALTFVVARFLDGPLAMIPGGALASGAVIMEPVTNWDPLRAVDTIEMQLAGEATSRTTWFLAHEGKGYIPVSLSFPPGKSWHSRADKDGTAIIRTMGNRYPVRLERTHDERAIAALVEIVKDKYDGGPPNGAGVWFFQVISAPDMAQ
jgi:hypothetical protein